MTEREGRASGDGPGTCEEARAALWPWDRPRPHTETETAALEHVEGCAACRAFFRRDLAVARAVRACGFEERAPRELRERVYAALARERAFGDGERAFGDGERAFGDGERSARAGGKWRGRVAAAVGALLVLLAVGGLVLALRPEPVQDAYVEDFVGRAVEETVVETPDPSRMSRFFMREMGLSLFPVSLEGGSPSRAMICLIRGRRAAMVEYEIEGYTVAHYRLPASETRARGRGVRLFSERGLSVARWEDGAFEHALVSDLPMERLAGVARREFAAR